MYVDTRKMRRVEVGEDGGADFAASYDGGLCGRVGADPRFCLSALPTLGPAPLAPLKKQCRSPFVVNQDA